MKKGNNVLLSKGMNMQLRTKCKWSYGGLKRWSDTSLGLQILTWASLKWQSFWSGVLDCINLVADLHLPIDHLIFFLEIVVWAWVNTLRCLYSMPRSMLNEPYFLNGSPPNAFDPNCVTGGLPSTGLYSCINLYVLALVVLKSWIRSWSRMSDHL